ncbi:MAG: TIGR04076 family protein [Flexilinea sp.]|nr:TIGR04076 family protein [Flexilinea sp.]
MKKCRITVMRKANYPDLSAKYENPIENACTHKEGEVFITNGWNKPEGLCQSAWDSMSAFVLALSSGGSGLYDGWMKDPRSAMISCNDGFRPVSFLIEALEEDGDQ